MSNFVRVPNQWFDIEDGKTFIGEMGHRRFTLWFILQKYSVESNMAKIIPIRIIDLKNGYEKLNGFKRNETIRKMLIELRDARLFKCDDLNETTKPSELIRLEIININITAFQRININIFDDKIFKIETLGFAIYCFLYKFHNINIQEENKFSQGYAECSRDFIGNVIGVKNKKTLSNSIVKLEKAKSLVKIDRCEYYEAWNEFGDRKLIWRPNRYIVWAKFDIDNKYYIGGK